MTSIYWLGAHKTATTYLQKSLDLSAEAVTAQGVRYLELDDFRDRYTRPLLYADPDRPAEPSVFGDGERVALIFDENIPGLVQHALSSRGFYPDTEERVATIVDHLGVEVDEIIFGVRNYADYLPSLYCETLKSTPFKTFDDYLRYSLGTDGFPRMNWYELLRRLAEAYPAARIRVYFQEDLRGHEAALLADVLGMSSEDFTMVTSSERIGFSGRAVEELHRLDVEGTVERRDVRRTVKTFPRSDGHAAFDPWDADQRHELTTNYERDRAWILADDTFEVLQLGEPADVPPVARPRPVEEPEDTSRARDGAAAHPPGAEGRSRRPDQPDLSVVIPVHDAGSTVGDLVEDLLGTPGLDVQVVLVDDASRDGSGDLVDQLAGTDRVMAFHHPRNAGAGVARNTGFRAAIGRYTLFFDADDLVHADVLGEVVPQLDRVGADVAMMPYHYERGGQSTDDSMNNYDEETWEEYLEGGPVRVGSLETLPRLLGFSNYPWNKVLRTDRYRAVGLRFGSTPVHNDILGHWHTLLFSRSILLVDQAVCTHRVDTTGKNLTNRHTDVRLALFDALDETYDLLEANPTLRSQYAHLYWSMVIRVAGWAGSRIHADHADTFDHLLTQHLLRANLTDYLRIRTRRDPALADAMLRKALS